MKHATQPEPGDLRAAYERARLLYQVSQTIHSTLEPQTALELILREAVRLMRASSGSLVLVNPNNGFLEIQAAHGLPVGASRLRLRVGEGITGWVARTGQPARVGDVSEDSRYLPVRPNVRSELAVPLEVAGELRGVLNVDSDREHAFSEEDQGLLQELAGQAAQVIHHTWLYEQLRLKAALFEALVKVSQTINSTLGLDDALRAVTREACGLMGARVCSLLMVDCTGEWLDLRASYGAGSTYLSKPRLSLNDSLLGTVVRRRKPFQIENVQTSGSYQSVEIARAEGLVSLLSVPLVYQGEAIGTLSVYTASPHNFSNEEIRILSALADLSGIAIEKARLYERIVDLEEQLRQNEKLSALGLLAAEVAHEIRNPLTVMKLLFQSLDLRFPVGDARGRDVAVIGEKMNQLNRIVEQILDFARHSEPQLQPVNVNQLIDDLELLIRHRAAQQEVRLETRPSPDLPPLMADATQIEQAFLNLTLNALEAMPHGGSLQISSRAVHLPRHSSTPSHVAVSFRDTGQGMTLEQRRQVTRSLLSSTKPGGTGLGLMIVARVIEAHGGKLRIASRPGKGTTITIVLPV
ncbi:MAG: GAF domain-containing protein [Verrucomicrobiales bacterium]|nr:GAF domain-containing protein [Verrucomicrobiales bacterium]